MPFNDISDDLTIADDEILWRRVDPLQVRTDPVSNQIIPFSGAFKDQRGPLSVEIASLANLEEALTRADGRFLAEFTARVAREVNCRIVKSPLPENPAHAQIYGNHKGGCPSQAQARSIAHQSRIIQRESESQ